MHIVNLNSVNNFKNNLAVILVRLEGFLHEQL